MNEDLLRGPAMAGGDIPKTIILGLFSYPKDNPDIHHNVNEQRVRPQERTEVLAFRLKAQRQRPAGLNQDFPQFRILS
jgi:hypothetical protein